MHHVNSFKTKHHPIAKPINQIAKIIATQTGRPVELELLLLQTHLFPQNLPILQHLWKGRTYPPHPKKLHVFLMHAQEGKEVCDDRKIWKMEI